MGSLEGVVSTHSAWIGKREVVEIRYRPEVLAFERLLDVAIERSCDQQVYATTDAQFATAKARLGDKVQRFDGEMRAAKASDQLYYLGRSPHRWLPLTPMQARQVNAALGAKALGAKVAGTDAQPADFLSPRQLALAARIAKLGDAAEAELSKNERPAKVAGLAAYEKELLATLERLESGR